MSDLLKMQFFAVKTNCLLLILCSVLSVGLQSAVCLAEVYKYIDDTGRTFYVDSKEKIPSQFRSQLNADAQSPAILPSISKVPSRAYKPSNKPKLTSPRPNYSLGRNRVEIFVTSWCGYCRQLETLLSSKNIRYKSYDIENSKEGEQLYQQLGGGGVPVTKVGSQVIRGYQPDEILRALGKKS